MILIFRFIIRCHLRQYPALFFEDVTVCFLQFLAIFLILYRTLSGKHGEEKLVEIFLLFPPLLERVKNQEPRIKS